MMRKASREQACEEKEPGSAGFGASGFKFWDFFFLRALFRGLGFRVLGLGVRF